MTVADQEKVLEWRSNPELSQYMYTDIKNPSLQNQIDWFEGTQKQTSSEYWIITLDGMDVGVVNLVKKEPDHGRSDWAFYLASPEVRGRGVGSKVETAIIYYVFKKLGLEKLHCQVFSTNESVIGLHKKFGFEVEGVLKRHFKRAGAWQDLYLLSLYKGEVDTRGYLNEEVQVSEA